jgi:xanthine dehydrogenase accessory factor
MFDDVVVVIKGAGDLATGVAIRLHRAGFPIIMTEIAKPTPVRRTVAFAEAIFEGESVVEGVAARKAETIDEAVALAHKRQIPILIDPKATIVRAIRPKVVVDAIIAKRNV